MTGKREVEERPPAPWGSFPLSELTVLAGIVLLAVGFAGQSPTPIALGVALAAIGGLEVSAREHFTGYRSHSTLLAGFAFVLITGLLLYVAALAPAIGVGVGAAAFLIAFLALRHAFRQASGGLSFKAGGFRR